MHELAKVGTQFLQTAIESQYKAADAHAGAKECGRVLNRFKAKVIQEAFPLKKREYLQSKVGLTFGKQLWKRCACVWSCGQSWWQAHWKFQTEWRSGARGSQRLIAGNLEVEFQGRQSLSELDLLCA